MTIYKKGGGRKFSKSTSAILKGISLTEGSFDITGTSTSFLAEYANSGTIIIEYANNAFYTMPLNIVTDDTTANLTIAWANSNISLANAYYTQGNIS